MRTDNLSRWVDELAATIEDLEKKVNAIETEPIPVPTDEYKLECTQLISGATISAEQPTELFSIPDLTGYDMLMVTLETVLDGITGQTFCPGSLFEASKHFNISTPQLYMNDPTSGYARYSAFSFHWEQRQVESELVDILAFDPALLQQTGERTVNVYGLKIERIVEDRTGFIKKVVNKILRKEKK